MFQHKIQYLILYISAQDVHTHVNFIPIRKRNVGMQDVWVNVLYHAIQHALHHAMVDVSIMRHMISMDINMVKVEVVLLDVH